MRGSQAGADRGERPLERRLHSSVQPLDSPRLEDDGALLDGVDGEARVLEPAQHPLPLPLDGRRIALDEDERRARRERLPEPHPRLHPGRLRGRGHRPEERLLARLRSERRGDECEPRARAQRRSQLEPGNEEACDHANTCSIRTHVLLSSEARRYCTPSSLLDLDGNNVEAVYPRVRLGLEEPLHDERPCRDAAAGRREPRPRSRA